MPTLTPEYPPTRVCVTCKEDLPASAYTKGNTIKYFRCKLCERKRLAAYRKKVKESKVLEVITCIACRDVVTGDDVWKTGKYAMKICVPCGHKFKNFRRPHQAGLAGGICMRCETYGMSSKCIGGVFEEKSSKRLKVNLWKRKEHKVDLDDSDDSE
jgi:protein-arginine kinase activator protein McsA